MSDGNDLLTSAQVAELLQVSLRTVERMRATGTGPPWLKIGKSVRYRRKAVLKWLAEQEDAKR